MHIKYLLYILFFTLLLAAKQSIAQDISTINPQNFKVSQLSDEQVTQYWKKFEDSGISEDEAYKILLKKGVTPQQVQELKDRVTLLGLTKKPGLKSSTVSEKRKVDFSRDRNDTVITPMIGKIKANVVQPNLAVYGTDFFNQTSIKFEPNFSVATPKSYVLGPGDEVIVLLSGQNESTQRAKISPEGNLKVDHVDMVYVNGFTIEQATNLIKNKMAKVYPALNSGQTHLAVNLGNTRSIKITLIGEVKTPGAYTMSALSTLFSALYNSGGPNVNGSLRYIEFIRNNKVYKIVDFYSFLQK
jgi:protein involved in polysaccharide export with SLBB domain